MTLRIGSLFTGTGALDLAAMDVFDADVAWHSQYEPPDKNGKPDTVQYAARILARHWPTTPNLGDITKVDWQAVLNEHGRPDILTGGFPCTDVSSAGKRAGLTPDTRSGLWNHMARAIAVLNPRLVIIENVEGLLSAKADRGLEPGAEALDEDAGTGRILRALGAVLGDLATLGFDAEWVRVAASEVGAPHPRKRVFVYAWPASQDAHLEPGLERRLAAPGQAKGGRARSDAGGRGGAPAAHADGCGFAGHGELPARRDALRRRVRDDAHRRGPAPADAGSEGLEIGRVEPDGTEREASERGHREPAADADGGGLPRHGELPAGRNAIRVGVRNDADGRHPATADAEGVRRGQGRTEPAGQLWRPDAAQRSNASDANADSRRWRSEVLDLRPGQPHLEWGVYEPAIRRWEHVLGRPAPWPTDLRGRLTPVFSEWMMGLPDGWVTCTPGPEGMTPAALRNAMLRALGNGVVRLQAATAIRYLHQRATAETALAA